MGIDNGASLPPSVAVEIHKKIPLGEKIQDIFNEKKSPLETLRKLAGLIKESVSKPTESTPETSTTTIQTEDNQQETDKKIVQIREQLGLIETKPEVETILPSEKRCLFPPKKSLLEEHSEAFKKEKHTAVGMVHYIQDIVELKKLHIPKAKKYYDAMRARGFEDHDVISSAKSLMADGINLNQLPKAIDRLHMTVGEHSDLGDYVSFDSYRQEIKDISAVDDQQFQKNFEQLNKYSFLERAKESYSSEFVETLKNGISPESELVLDHINQLCSDIPIDHLKDIVNSSSGSGLIKSNFNINTATYSLDNIYKNYCQSEFSSDKPLSIPEDILSKIDASYYSREFNNLNNLHNRDHQKFFLNQRCNSDHLFDHNHIAKSEFYLDYFNSSFNTEKTINLSQDILSTFDEQDQKIWQDASNLKDVNHQKFFLDYFKANINRKDLINEMFDNDHQPSSVFFQKYYCQVLNNNKLAIINLPENISSYSEIDKTYWNKIISLDKDQQKILLDIGVNVDLKIFNSEEISKIRGVSCIHNGKQKWFDINGFPTMEFYASFNTIKPTSEIISKFSPEDQKILNCIININVSDTERRSIQVFIINNRNHFDEFFDSNNNPKSLFCEKYIKYKENIPENDYIKNNFIKQTLTPELIKTFNFEDQKFWNTLVNLNSDSFSVNTFITNNRNHFNEFFNDNGHPTSVFFEQFIKNNLSFSKESSLLKLLTPEVVETFNPENQKFWNTILNIDNKNIQVFIINNKDHSNEFFDNNNQLTKTFFDSFRKEKLSDYNDFFEHNASKNDWQTDFGKETIDNLLNSLPTATFEKRNAFTHNEYDRTSKFFDFLINNSESNFVLDKENILIATDYIKTFELSSTPIVFRYFKNITEFNQGKIDSLPQECIDSGIKTINELKDQINYIRKQCLSSKPFENLNLSPLQLNFLSVATGHSSNTFTRIPIEKIVQDFSEDLSRGEIIPLSPEFVSRSTQIDKVKTKNTVDLSNNKEFQIVSNEVLASIKNIDTIDDLKIITTEILQSKIADLSKQDSNDFLNKQIKIFKSGVEFVSDASSIDDMVKVLVSLNINFGKDQEKYNSVLRQLVFRKVLKKHNGSNYTERLKDSLENNPGVTAISENLNFLNNLVKDHALNFETNEEGYWQKDSFTDIKKYEKVLKKNLGISSLTKELESISRQFEITKSNSTLNIEMIPDRGITGELAGYMANVCYTKVYPLLKTYPNVVPYKFIASPENDNPQIIGSTLVFRVDTANNEPVLLIRAFNVPDESSLDIGSFFEKFVDSLSQTAKELGIKKIITAGTPGTISNYPTTNNYVISKYVQDQVNVPLKNTFDFNGHDHDITNKCYLVRDLSH